MKLIILLVILFINLSQGSLKAVDDNDLKSYTLKLFDANLTTKKNILEIMPSPEFQKCFQEFDDILDSNKLPTYNADFRFEIDDKAQLRKLSLINIKEYDRVKYREFLQSFLSLDFPGCLGAYSDYGFNLEAATLYVDRPYLDFVPVALPTIEDIKDKVSSLDNDFTLFEPKFIDYPFIGQEIILVNKQGLYLKTFVDHKQPSKLFLKAFLAYDENEKQIIDLDLILTIKDQKNIFTEVIQSGFAQGLKAGLVNSYTSYGLAPGLLALMGMTGKAIIETETEDSFSLIKGEKLQIITVEKEK